MNNRRKAQRVVITAVAEVNNLEDNSMQEGYVANISTTGIGVFMKKPLKAGSPVEIKMSFYTANGVKDVGQIMGKIKRIEPISTVYNIGIEFEGLHPVKDHELISFLNAAHQTF